MSAPSGGTYADRHRMAPAALRWSHAARFRLARELVRPLAGRRLLDYGCGDGTFLHAVRDLFPDSLGVEVDPFLVDEATRRLGGEGLRFAGIEALERGPTVRSGWWCAWRCWSTAPPKRWIG
jgi:hypothetical protein